MCSTQQIPRVSMAENRKNQRSGRRALMLVAVMVLLLVPIAAFATSQTFPDVPPDRWDYNDIEWAIANGIMTGRADGKLYPDDSLRRGQAAALAHRLYDAIPAGATGPVGPAGADGADGVDGTPGGLSGLVWVAEGRAVNNPRKNDAVQVTVSCPPGKMVTGGGGTSAHHTTALTASVPSSTMTSWTVEFLFTQNLPSAALFAEAMCADVQATPAP
jgi:hypothetical protein